MEALLTEQPKPEPKAKPKKVTQPKTYRELQKALKVLKKEGKTTIRLNSKKEVLLAEWNQLNK